MKFFKNDICLIILIAGAVLFSGDFVSGQNIFDGNNSLKFASYLYHTNQYDLAAEELERAVYYYPHNDSLKYSLVHTYLKGKHFDKGKLRLDTYFPDKNKLSADFSRDYCRLLLSLDQPEQARLFLLTDNNLTRLDKRQLDFEMQMLGYDWENARSTFYEINLAAPGKNDIYNDIFNRIDHAKYKKPGLALAMSAIIPGAGKAYTGNWKDGLISLVFVGGTAFQAVRYFNKKGPESGYFIAYASIATSFYIGNLYGSYKAARKHNLKIRNSIRESIRSIIDNSY